MSQKYYMPFFVADYLGDTQHLSTEQHGCYILLLCHYWRIGFLPKDDESLARIVRLQPKIWQKNRAILAGLFLKNWKHKRVEFELQKVRDGVNMKSENGRKAAKIRWEKTISTRLVDADALPTHCDGIADACQTHMLSKLKVKNKTQTELVENPTDRDYQVEPSRARDGVARQSDSRTIKPKGNQADDRPKPKHKPGRVYTTDELAKNQSRALVEFERRRNQTTTGEPD